MHLKQYIIQNGFHQFQNMPTSLNSYNITCGHLPRCACTSSTITLQCFPQKSKNRMYVPLCSNFVLLDICIDIDLPKRVIVVAPAVGSCAVGKQKLRQNNMLSGDLSDSGIGDDWYNQTQDCNVQWTTCKTKVEVRN